MDNKRLKSLAQPDLSVERVRQGLIFYEDEMLVKLKGVEKNHYISQSWEKLKGKKFVEGILFQKLRVA